MKIWLVGADGMLGHAFSSLLRRHAKVTATDLEVDIADGPAVTRFATNLQPDWIFNAAAYTQVDRAETEEALALRVNGHGPGHLAAAARATGAGLVHVSTDYVFSGTATEPIPTDAPTAPQSAYGRTKLVGEERVLQAIEQGMPGYVVRTAWLFGEHGNNFVETMARHMREHAELRVVADQRGCPTYTADLARAAWQLVERGAPSGVYHFTNSCSTTWHDYAERILVALEELGFPVKTERVVPITTAQYPLPAPRPAYSVLSTKRYEAAVGESPRPWEAALLQYLNNLRKEVE